MPNDSAIPKPKPVATPADFDPDGALSREFLLRRRCCCEEGCRNCPYGFTPVPEAPLA